jgi:branched-chain amino acid transport system substrate-binding protein
MLRFCEKNFAGQQGGTMKRRNGIFTGRALGLGAALTIATAVAASAQTAPAPVKLGIVSFLSGPAASPFGVPGRNGAEILIEALNAGTVPPPYNTIGLGGAKIEAKYVDEAGSTAQVVTEFRNLVQRDQVDAVVGYISSGSCLAVTPVAEELKALTVYFDCGTPRIFEEKPRRYVFRPAPTATMDSVGAARYLLAKKKNVSVYSGINQNYAWGQDSWRDFASTIAVLAPKARVDKELFPKLFAGEFGAEISTLLISQSQAVHTSFWDGDLESFVYQSEARGLSKRMPIVATTLEASMWRLRDRIPDGTIVGGRGPHGPFAPKNVLNDWFHKVYVDRYGTPPTYPSYQMVLSVLGLKVAWDKAQAKKGAKPTTEEIADAFEGIEYDSPSGRVKLAIGNGHQGIQETAYGTFKYNKQTKTPEIVDVIRFPAECVNPPAGITADDWIKEGMKGAKCN